MTTTISDLISALQNIESEHGDLPIVGGEILDDTDLCTPVVIDDEGCDIAMGYGRSGVGVFLTARVTFL